jgi:hypothetical protein
MRRINNCQKLIHRDPVARSLPRFKPQVVRSRVKYSRKGRGRHQEAPNDENAEEVGTGGGYPRFGRSSWGTVGAPSGILRAAWKLRSLDRRLAQTILQTHRRIHSPSGRLLRSEASLRAARVTREAARAAPAHYRSSGGGRWARPAPPPVSAFSEVETMFRCGFRSIRAWRRARRYGGFPEPARVSTEGPVWTERQIGAWLGEDQLMDQLEGVRATTDEAMTKDEAAILRALEAA